jgi:hypothetical protein
VPVRAVGFALPELELLVLPRLFALGLGAEIRAMNQRRRAAGHGVDDIAGCVRRLVSRVESASEDSTHLGSVWHLLIPHDVELTV